MRAEDRSRNIQSKQNIISSYNLEEYEATIQLYPNAKLANFLSNVNRQMSEIC